MLQDSSLLKPEPMSVFTEPSRWTLTPAKLIVLSVLVAYANSFQGTFILDDFRSIHENEDIQSFWPPWRVLFGGLNVSRPVVSLTLALNYALGGCCEIGYHIVNVLIHIGASLTLWAVVRRTLQLPSMPRKYVEASSLLALVVALIFAVHPLQTQSVTYIIQRCESLMGLFGLLTLYCFIRSTEASASSEKICKNEKSWQNKAVLMCALGMASKQAMAAIPLLIWFYDRTFISGSLQQAWTLRRRFYLMLFSTWIIMALTLILTPSLLGAGFGQAGITPWEYARSQGGVLLHYLYLCVWPRSQCLDYDWPVARTAMEIIPGTVSILLLLGLSFWAWFRKSAKSAKSAWGFVGAWFFLILAPTSSIMPIVDLAFEHRMYLPLASVVILIVMLLFEIFTRLGSRWDAYFNQPRGLNSIPSETRSFGRSFSPWSSLRASVTWFSKMLLRSRLDHEQNASSKTNCGFQMGLSLVNFKMLVALWLVFLTITTLQRNADYDSELIMWRDVVKKSPTNVRAQNNYGLALFGEKQYTEAKVHYDEALCLSPTYWQALFNTGLLYETQKNYNQALEYFERSHKLNDYPKVRLRLADCHYYVGMDCVMRGQLHEAASHLQAALNFDPDALSKDRSEPSSSNDNNSGDSSSNGE